MILVFPIGRKNSIERRVIGLGIKREQGLILNLKTQSNFEPCESSLVSMSLYIIFIYILNTNTKHFVENVEIQKIKRNKL